MNPTPSYQEPQPRGSGLLTALFAGALIALIAANIYLYVQVHKRCGQAPGRAADRYRKANCGNCWNRLDRACAQRADC